MWNKNLEDFHSRLETVDEIIEINKLLSLQYREKKNGNYRGEVKGRIIRSKITSPGDGFRNIKICLIRIQKKRMKEWTEKNISSDKIWSFCIC